MTYTETRDAILNAPPSSPLYGARLAWPLAQYVQKCGSNLCLQDGSNYVANAQDSSASDWIKGGDKPPVR